MLLDVLRTEEHLEGGKLLTNYVPPIEHSMTSLLICFIYILSYLNLLHFILQYPIPIPFNRLSYRLPCRPVPNDGGTPRVDILQNSCYRRRVT